MSGEPPIVTWMSDPNGKVWAIDAADVMTPAPDAEPIRDMTWEEVDRFIPAGTGMALGAHISWHLSVVGAEFLRVPVIGWIARLLGGGRKTRR